VAREPAREAVEAGEEDAFGHVRLVELVAHFRLEPGGDDDLAPEVGVLGEPGVEREVGPRGERAQGVLVDDPFVERRRLDEQDEVVAELRQAAYGERNAVPVPWLRPVRADFATSNPQRCCAKRVWLAV
jgi:hypothetical protein